MTTWRTLVLLTAAGTLAAPAKDVLAQADLAKLRNPAKREAEARRLISAGEEPSERILTGFRFHEAPQCEGEPLYVFLASYDYDFEREEDTEQPWFDGYKIENPDELFQEIKLPAKPGDATEIAAATEPKLEWIKDHLLMVFDCDGKEIRPFGGDNYIDGGFVADLNGDGILERTDVTHYGVTKELTATVLEVGTIEKTPRAFLRVVTEWDVRGNDDSEGWTFTCRDKEGDGFVEIILGPGHEEALTEERVVFRWNKDSEQFESDALEGTPLQVFQEGEKLKALYEKRPRIEKVVKPDPAPSKVKEKESVPPDPPFVYHSLKGTGDAGIMAFFNGKPARDSFHSDEANADEDPNPTHLPKGFWDLDPKTAAMSFAESNRTGRHRGLYKLALDDRNDIAPPKSGWLVHDYNSAACYTYTTHQFALRFGIEKPVLVHIEHSSQGIVGANPLVDRAAYAMRVLPLSQKESRFLADTIFWLDRIRSKGGSNEGGGFGSSADGHARLTFHEGGKAPREIADNTIWTTMSIPARWAYDYEPETCLNFVEHLLHTAWRKRLGERWNTVAPLVHRNLGTPLEERLKPRQDQNARELHTALALEAFALHERDPLPASLLRDIVSGAGAEGLTDLLQPIQKLSDSLPPINGEDREYENLATRFARDHFGNFRGGKPEDDEKRTAWNRYQELREKRKYLPGPVLRHATAFTLRQLKSADRPDLLMTWARGIDQGNAWALQRLEKHHPEAHADILREGFEEADEHGRRRIFNTLAAANPKAALALRNSLSPEELHDLLLDVAQFEEKSDPPSLLTRVPALFKIADNPPEKKPWHRDYAMQLLEGIELIEADQKRLDDLLLAQLAPVKPPDDDADGLGITRTSLPGALAILVKRPDAERYWDHVVNAIESVHYYSEFEAVLRALATLPKVDADKRKNALEQLVRHRLHESDGMMNDVFAAALALDLRGLTGELQAMATSGPRMRDGLGADFSGGNFKSPRDYRYHTAREVLALWSEPDQETRARMWIAFALSHHYSFGEDRSGRSAGAQLRERAAAEIAHLAAADRQEVIATMIGSLPPGTPIQEATRDWLGKLGR